MALARTFTGILMVGACFVAGCSDEEPPVPVTQDEYDDEVQRLCNQHGEILARAYGEPAPDSDAEEAAFYTADFVPRARALVRQLADLGFPPDEDARYRESLNRVIEALAELEAEPFQYIDERHRGVLTPEEDLLVIVHEGLAGADVPC